MHMFFKKFRFDIYDFKLGPRYFHVLLISEVPAGIFWAKAEGDECQQTIMQHFSLFLN